MRMSQRPIYYAVTMEWGPGREAALPMREQPRWDEHAAFMDGLADDGFVVLGGPLDDASRALLIVNAASERAVRARLAADPWMPLGIRRIAKIERWEILLSAGWMRGKRPTARGA